MENAIIVVGIGNPGKKYEQTPHNAGFMAIDELALRCECVLRRKLGLRAFLGRCEAGGRETWLIKPATFVNNSGIAVSAALRKMGASMTPISSPANCVFGPEGGMVATMG